MIIFATVGVIVQYKMNQEVITEELLNKDTLLYNEIKSDAH